MSKLASNGAAVRLAKIPSQGGSAAPSTEPGGRRLAFPAGSMGPKVEACTRFVTATGRSAAIGALRDAPAVLAGVAGTTITA